MADKEKTAITYTIRLCKNGKEIKSIPNWVSPQPSVGDPIDGKWKICGVLCEYVPLRLRYLKRVEKHNIYCLGADWLTCRDPTQHSWTGTKRVCARFENILQR